MKSFFQKIWSFVLWLVALVVAVFRGRKVISLPEDEDDGRARNTDLTCLTLRSWLGKVEKVFLHAKYVTLGKTRKQVLKIGIVLPGLLADHYFQNLRVTVFLAGQSSGVTYGVASGGIMVYANYLHSMPIEPISALSAMMIMKRIDKEYAYVTNVKQIRLELKDESRDFSRDLANDFFCPAATKAAGF
jgi:uncharacterized membrane protein YfcA